MLDTKVVLFVFVAGAMTMGIMKCVHRPAAASALIIVMGYLSNFEQILGLVGVVILLVFEAIIFNRIIGGLPYPIWRADLTVARSYGVLAGIPETGTTFWQQLAAKTFQQR